MSPSLESVRQPECTTIFFDVGGVLLDDFIDTKVIDLALKYSKEPADLLQLRREIRPLADAGEISDREFWRALLKAEGVEAAEEDFKVDHLMHPIEEGMELVRRLKQNGCKLAILSNDSAEMFAKKKELFGFAALFDDMIVSSEHGCIKPHPEIYHIALRRMQVRPQEAVFIDDRSENLLVAEKLGMRTVLYHDARQAEMDLIKLGIALPLLNAR